MCGIHGFVDKKLSPEQGLSVIHKMLKSTHHRGPDSSSVQQFDFGALGHNRLSIIDLSEAANQPYRVGSYTVVFNGEIYNYREIRTELIREGVEFKSDSDTEVLLQTYILWGESGMTRFLGMWALAIWNEADQTLFCSRDRFGIKPFYYIFESGRFYFASEVKSLKLSPIFSNELNINQLGRSLQMGWITYEAETIFAKVQQLKPGHNLVWKNDAIRSWRYYAVNAHTSGSLSGDELATEFESIFLNSLQLHLRSDVQLGATLSGGIDSSSIVSAMINALKVRDLQTFSVFYEGDPRFDERPFVQEIEKKYPKLLNLNYLTPDEDSVAEDFDRITYHNDFPLLGSSPISQYFVMKKISEFGIKVILSGQGADDYLGGYMYSYYRLYAEYLRSMKLLTGMRELRQQKNKQNLAISAVIKVILKSLMTSIYKEDHLYRIEYKRYYPQVLETDVSQSIRFEESGFKRMNDFHYHLLRTTSLPSLLHYEDRNSMAFSIESRVPFLDHRLVELGLRSSSQDKIHDGYTKYVLREAMKSHLPEKIRLRTDKKGFVTPGEVKWLRSNLTHLLEIDYANFPNIHKKRVSHMIEAFKKGDNSNANVVWRVASTNKWLKTI